MKQFTSLAAALLVAVLLCTAATSAQTVKIGSLTLPADCALAKNERPRLLFRGRDLPKYKARIRGVMKDDFERFKRYWDRKLAKKERCDHLCLGVLYQLTGERRYADAIRNDPEFKKPGRFYQRPFTVDLIFDTLTPDEVEREVGHFLKDADKKFRWGMRGSALWHGIALRRAGSAREKEIDKWLAEGYKAAKAFTAQVNRWAEDRGGDFNSFSYVGNHSVIHMGGHLLALSNALGEDAWQACPWARNLGAYYVYHYFPWRNSAIHFGNTTAQHSGPHRGSLGAGFCLAAAPAQFRDGLMQWWIDHCLVYQDAKLKGWPKVSREMSVMLGLWGRILFHDETLPMREPKDFPPSRFFAYRGNASMRENWTPDATFVHFTSGTQNAYLPDGRQNADANTFTIYKKGILALDTGGQHQLDENRLKLKPGRDHHNYNYANVRSVSSAGSSTISNCPTVGTSVPLRPPIKPVDSVSRAPSVKGSPDGGSRSKTAPARVRHASCTSSRPPTAHRRRCARARSSAKVRPSAQGRRPVTAPSRWSSTTPASSADTCPSQRQTVASSTARLRPGSRTITTGGSFTPTMRNG